MEVSVANVERLKTDLAKQLLTLMFPDENVHKWNVDVTKDGIFYCSDQHDKSESCDYERIDIREKKVERFRHKKRGTHYNKQAVGILQIEPNVVLKDGDQLVVYVGEEDGGKYWLRTPEEFHDGRFEYLPSKIPVKPVLPKGGNLERLISELRKQAEASKLSADYNGSYQGGVTASKQVKLLDKIEQAASLDYLVKYDTKSFFPKTIRQLKLNAMWTAHRAFLNPFAIVEGDIPKERKDLTSYYGMFLDACDTIDNFYVFDKNLVQKNYPDEVFDRMIGQIEYVIKRANNLDLGEDVKTLSENCVASILRYASNFSDTEPTTLKFTAVVGRRDRDTKTIDSVAELLRLINGGAYIKDIKIDRS
jgi:hypothetical protein